MISNSRTWTAFRSFAFDFGADPIDLAALRASCKSIGQFERIVQFPYISAFSAGWRYRDGGLKWSWLSSTALIVVAIRWSGFPFVRSSLLTKSEFLL